MTIIDGPGVPRALNDLARHQMVARLLADIEMDMRICMLEGWDPLEYARALKTEIDRITSEVTA